MRTIVMRWPSVVAIFFAFLNVDLVVMPVLSELGVHGVKLFICATVAATTEVLYWYWYVGWLARNVPRMKSVQRTRRKFVKRGYVQGLIQLWDHAKDMGLKLWDWWCDQAKGHMELNTPLKRRLMSEAENAIKTTGILMVYPLMIGLGSVPLGWVVGIAINRVYRAPGAMVLLLVVNALKAWGLGMIYLWFPLWAKLSVLGLLVLLLVVKVVRFLRTQDKEEYEEEPIEICEPDEKGSP